MVAEPSLGKEYEYYLYDPSTDQIISNSVKYIGEQELFEINKTDDVVITRNEGEGLALEWIVEENGDIVHAETSIDASLPLDFSFTTGNAYRVWLEADLEVGKRTISNILEFELDVTRPYSITLGDNYVITRSGEIGDNVNWNFYKNGNRALQRSAKNGLSYRYFSNTAYSTIDVYLTEYIDGAYQTVSNTITYYPTCN